jgi:3-deoxy-7-phosphoheptulonate synthase
MLVVMQSRASELEVTRVVEVIQAQGLTPHVMPGATRTAIGVTGNTGAVDKALFEVLPGVEEAIRVTKPFKLASREMKRDDTVLSLTQGAIGPQTFTVVAGPCSVENETMILKTAEFLVSRGVKFLRAGAFKPRTSPYAFQGMGIEGLQILQRARQRTGIGIVTELMDTEFASAVEEAADIIQIGTRNMQNF